MASWYATGNNVQLQGDIARRICHDASLLPKRTPKSAATSNTRSCWRTYAANGPDSSLRA
jgi:hypothetical protein